MIEGIDRRTLGYAITILVVTTTFGLYALPPIGVVLGPLIDYFLTPRILARRGYKSPGAPLWAATVGGVAMLPAIRAGTGTDDVRDFQLYIALAAAFGALLLGVVALRTPLAKLGAIGIGLAFAAGVVAVTLHSQGT
jgi:hypothetical protein